MVRVRSATTTSLSERVPRTRVVASAGSKPRPREPRGVLSRDAATARWYAARVQEVERALRARLTGPGRPAALVAAMRYALLGPGKRVRPLLALAAAEAVAGARGRPRAHCCACAGEMGHAYSLVHDDLPAMDDDDMRRGRPTVHIRCGEAMAILAGDALLSEAFALLADEGKTHPGRGLRMVGELARAAGIDGMVGGQCRDIEAEGRKRISPAALRRIHQGKTGALIRASVRLGALAADATERELAALTDFGEALGLAFQIADDLLDETAAPEVLGRAGGGDRARGKGTYPRLLGLAGARRALAREIERGRAALAPFGPRAAALGGLLDDVVRRAT